MVVDLRTRKRGALERFLDGYEEGNDIIKVSESMKNEKKNDDEWKGMAEISMWMNFLIIFI